MAIPAAVSVAFGGIAATYLFLRFLLQFTQDAREPPAILTSIPFLQPLAGMIGEKERFYIRLRDQYKLPIYTLRLPFTRIYIVNDTALIPALQKQWRTVSFASLAADAGSTVGMTQEAVDLMHKDLTKDEGFSTSWPKYVMPSMAPGSDLDNMNRTAIQIFAGETEKLRAGGNTKTVGLREWSRAIMVTSSTEAVWGPQNPYKDPVVADAWKTFESGFLTIAMFPMASLFFPAVFRAREVVAAALIKYMRDGGHEQASGLVHKRHEHHRGMFGLSLEDFARGELGNTFAVLGNTTPCAMWVLFHIFGDETVLSDIRQEVSALVEEGYENDTPVSTIDLAKIKTQCPILMSTFQEVLRYRAINPGPRKLLEDVTLDGRILLKKDSMLMIPAPVQHTDTTAWGDDAREFDHLRFVRQPGPGKKRPNRTAFRAFGGGHVLCPGRHFASTEIMALSALLALQFNIRPVHGKWDEPTWVNSPGQAGFPVIDNDIMIELEPIGPERKWHIQFSRSDEAIGIVAEDVETGGRGAI
ncbi:cholesterol 7-alpha-monooxygenase [Podospora australis]|uniref:Cholesterol 7-alpha-monooxygenase n=1 Tax=Podospora australis TaxID=1536484 RepID=A0AAN7AER8_9PEZI|nr:cholesterol 7-alpha-monooxygenase [Podospora australis]